MPMLMFLFSLFLEVTSVIKVVLVVVQENKGYMMKLLKSKTADFCLTERLDFLNSRKYIGVQCFAG